jgi:hypothetical protein
MSLGGILTPIGADLSLKPLCLPVDAEAGRE